MSDDNLCKICHKETPREGRLLCDECLGLNKSELPKAATTSKICPTCGEIITPYLIGKVLRASGECRSCYFKRRYGPNWKPGGRTQEECNVISRAKRAAKRAIDGCEVAKPAYISGVNGKAVTILFAGNDEPLFDQLQTLADKERRTIQQQILYFLDSVSR